MSVKNPPQPDSTAMVSTRKAITWASMVPILLLVVTSGLLLKFGTHASTAVPGESYLVCDNPATFLTSPYTYHALSSGSQSYTVSQYQALSGYGTTLPPLPTYISAQGASAPAATIYAPGASVSIPAYNQPETPTIQFFEGGAYGGLAMDTVSGEEFIGGSAAGFPEPTFDSAGSAGGINGQNGSFYYSGGTSTLASTANVGATAITTSSAIDGYITSFTFADGKSYPIGNVNGTSITLDTPLTSAESAGQQVWANSTSPLAYVAASAAQGATTLTFTSSTIPMIKWQQINIGDHSYNLRNVTGTQAGGYTVTIDGLDLAAAAHTPVYYSDLAGGVAVSYLDINHDEHNTTGTIYTGVGWTVTHNKIHDGNSAPGLGVAIYGGDQGDIEYNCLSKMGDYGVNIFGTNSVFDHNEIYESNYQPDPGCGCSGGGKWWGTLNADIVANAFVNSSPGQGAPIWFDNGNSGSKVQDNYFYKSTGGSVESETGFNLNISNNKFVDSGWGSGSGGCGDNCNGQINLNSSGGFHVPNSRYDNQVIVSGNQFINDWEGIDIWESGARNCSNSGESYGSGTDSGYCTGGFPNTANTDVGGQYYFSHINNNFHDGAYWQLAQNASAGATQVLVSGSVATNDQIGFADPAQTSTSSTTAVTALTGTQTINASATAGFPSSGQLRVGVTNAMSSVNDASWTGAILSYTGKTASSFTGVSLVRGKGALTGPIEQVQPYKATAETCFANDCLVTITPALASNVSAGTDTMNTGTCQLYATAALTPTNQLAPDGTSYWDGCQWRNKNISITGNNFSLDRTAINAGTPLIPGTMNCTAATDCGINFQAFQEAGEPPFSDFTDANSMMSNSTLTTCPSWDPGCTTSPLKNINALSNPPSATAGNNEAAENIIWSNNSYAGPWQWHTYWYGTCGQLPSDPVTGHSMPAGACNVDFAHWQSDWQQDTASTWTATPTPTPSGTPTPTPTPTSTPTATPTPTPTPTPSGKVGDLNHDNSVNIFDLSILLSHWATSDATSDINADGTVNIFDLSILLSHWGT